MPKLTDEFPAIVPAYDFVMPSYQWLLSRVESADTRLTNLLTIIYTLTLGTPVFARAVRPQIDLAHPLFIAAMILFLLAAFVAIVGRVRTGLALPDPGFLWANTLEQDVDLFKSNAIYFAGEHFKANKALIDEKAAAAVRATVLLFLEVVTLIIWIAWSVG